MAISKTLSWGFARSACQSSGGDLVSIHDGEEDAFVREVAMKGDLSAYWMGVNDRQQKRFWKWVDGSPVDFINWGPSFPNPSEGKETCGVYVPEKREWQTRDCQRGRNGYICRKKAKLPDGPASTPLPATTLKPGMKWGCRDGWIEWSQGKHCYKFVNESKSFNDARRGCQDSAIGADLVSIQSLAENDFVFGNINQSKKFKLF